MQGMSSTLYNAEADAGLIASAVIAHSDANMATVARMTFAMGKRVPAGAAEMWMADKIRSDTESGINLAMKCTRDWTRQGEYVGNDESQITDYMMLYGHSYVEVFDMSMMSAQFPEVDQFTFAMCTNLKMIDINDDVMVRVTGCYLRAIRYCGNKYMYIRDLGIGKELDGFTVCVRGGTLHVAFEISAR